MGLFSSIGNFLGGPVAGAIGGLLNSSHNNASIGRAGADRIAGYDAGLGAVQGAQTDIRSVLAPYMTQGGAGVNKLAELLGLGGDTAGAMAGLKENPVYKALFQNGQETVLQNASATGGLRGGNTQDSLGHLGADTLAQVYQMMVSNLGNLSELGAKTGLGYGALTNDNARSQAQLQVGRGQAASDMVLQKIGMAPGQTGGAPSGGLNGTLQNIGQLLGGLQNFGTDWDAVHAVIPF